MLESVKSGIWRLKNFSAYRRQILKRVVLIIIGIFLIHLFQNLYFLYFTMFYENQAYKRSMVMDQIQMDDAKSCKTYSTSHHNQIPRIVHQMWIGDKPLPSRYLECIDTWKSQRSSVQYMFWNDTSIREFLIREYPWFMDLYYSYPYTMNRCDAWRYVVLFHYGGAYFDVKIYCPQGLEDFYKLIGNAQIGLVPSNPYGFNGYVMFAAKKTNFMKNAVLNLFEAFRWYYTPYLNIMLGAGPLYVASQFNQYPFKEHVRKIPEQFLETRCNSKAGGNWSYWDTRLIWFVHRNLWFFSILLKFVSVLLVIAGCLYLHLKIKSRFSSRR